MYIRRGRGILVSSKNKIETILDKNLGKLLEKWVAPGGGMLKLRGICKSFEGIQALSGVDLQLNLNEIVGLVGDNGAGKSTLIKIICGNYQATSGEIEIEGQKAHFHKPEDAREKGIEVVYQDLGLAPNINASANIFLGREERLFPTLWSPLKFSSMKKRTRELLDRLKSDSNLELPVSKLSGGQRQAVAIARTLKDQAKLIIMDEPLAAISIRQVKEVLDLIRSLKEQGQGVLLVSHRLDDLFAVCDRLVILQRGKKVADSPIEKFTVESVTGLITGAIRSK